MNTSFSNWDVVDYSRYNLQLGEVLILIVEISWYIFVMTNINLCE